MSQRDGLDKPDDHPHFTVTFSDRYEVACPSPKSEERKNGVYDIIVTFRGYEKEIEPATFWKSAVVEETPAAFFSRYIGKNWRGKDRYAVHAAQNSFTINVRVVPGGSVYIHFKVPYAMFVNWSYETDRVHALNSHMHMDRRGADLHLFQSDGRDVIFNYSTSSIEPLIDLLLNSEKYLECKD